MLAPRPLRFASLAVLVATLALPSLVSATETDTGDAIDTGDETESGDATDTGDGVDATDATDSGDTTDDTTDDTTTSTTGGDEAEDGGDAEASESETTSGYDLPYDLTCGCATTRDEAPAAIGLGLLVLGLIRPRRLRARRP